MAPRLTLRLCIANQPSERPDGPDPAREVLVVAVVPASVGEIDVGGHVRIVLRRGPVFAVVVHSGVAEIADAGRLQSLVHLLQFVVRRKEPVAHAVEAERGAKAGGTRRLGTALQHFGSVALSGADRRAFRARDVVAEATPFR